MRDSQTRYAVLGMLSIAPMSGYDIKKLIENSVGYFWAESYGQIYPALKTLVAQKLVTKSARQAPGRRRRHVYRLTAAGRTKLRSWLAEESMPKAERNELLLKLFFGDAIDPRVTKRHIEQFRAQQRGLIGRYDAIGRELKAQHRGNPNLPYWLMTLRYGIRVRRALLNWSEETLAQLPPKIKRRRRRRQSRSPRR
jgi:PadR family transcriptional regulator, regulatory protein AphA